MQVLHSLQQKIGQTFTNEVIRSLGIKISQTTVNRVLLQLLRLLNLNASLPSMKVDFGKDTELIPQCTLVFLAYRLLYSSCL